MATAQVRPKPAWLAEFRRRTALIDCIEMAYTNGCECSVCARLREVGEELGQLFIPPTEAHIRQVRP